MRRLRRSTIYYLLSTIPTPKFSLGIFLEFFAFVFLRMSAHEMRGGQDVRQHVMPWHQVDKVDKVKKVGVGAEVGVGAGVGVGVGVRVGVLRATLGPKFCPARRNFLRIGAWPSLPEDLKKVLTHYPDNDIINYYKS